MESQPHCRLVPVAEVEEDSTVLPAYARSESGREEWKRTNSIGNCWIPSLRRASRMHIQTSRVL